MKRRPGSSNPIRRIRECFTLIKLYLGAPYLNLIEAAATSPSALTAWQALFVRGTLAAGALKGGEEATDRNKGVRVLATSAPGGVGSWVVGLAAAAGAGAVIAICGRNKGALVFELGATEVLNYNEIRLGDWLKQTQVERECAPFSGVLEVKPWPSVGI